MTEVTAAGGAILYPSMFEPAPAAVPGDKLRTLYGNSPAMFEPEPPPKLPPQAGLYNSPQMFEGTLAEQERHWQGQAAALPAATRSAAAAGLAGLPAEIRGTLVGSGMDQNPAVIGWLARLPR